MFPETDFEDYQSKVLKPRRRIRYHSVIGGLFQKQAQIPGKILSVGKASIESFTQTDLQ